MSSPNCKDRSHNDEQASPDGAGNYTNATAGHAGTGPPRPGPTWAQAWAERAARHDPLPPPAARRPAPKVGTLRQQLAKVFGRKMPAWLGGEDLTSAFEEIRERTPAEQLAELLRQNPKVLGPALLDLLLADPATRERLADFFSALLADELADALRALGVQVPDQRGGRP